jgi:hypothetical protein
MLTWHYNKVCCNLSKCHLLVAVHILASMLYCFLVSARAGC